jgi:hypothetical protein
MLWLGQTHKKKKWQIKMHTYDELEPEYFGLQDLNLYEYMQIYK